jgi:hypothetical protein
VAPTTPNTLGRNTCYAIYLCFNSINFSDWFCIFLIQAWLFGFKQRHQEYLQLKFNFFFHELQVQESTLNNVFQDVILSLIGILSWLRAVLMFTLLETKINMELAF